MAEGKKGFILYADIIHTVKKLPIEKRGELFTVILEYVNDLDPKCEDLLVDLVWEPIKRQMKRDLEHWESIKIKRSDAGKLGGRPRKQKEANKANGSFDKQTKAKKAVIVKEKVIVKDIVKVKEKVNKTNIPAFPDFLIYAKTIKIYHPSFDFQIEAKYNSWNEAGWKDGNNKKIANWKTKLQNTMVYFKKDLSIDNKDYTYNEKVL